MDSRISTTLQRIGATALGMVGLCIPLSACQGGSLTGGYRAVEQSVWGMTLVADAKQALMDANCSGETCERYPNPLGCTRLVVDASPDSTGEACGTCYRSENGQEVSQHTCGLLGGVPILCLANTNGTTRCTLSSKELVQAKAADDGPPIAADPDPATICSSPDEADAIRRAQLLGIQSFVNELNGLLDKAREQALASGAEVDEKFKNLRFSLSTPTGNEQLLLDQLFARYKNLIRNPPPEPSDDDRPQPSFVGGIFLGGFDHKALRCESPEALTPIATGDQAEELFRNEGKDDLRCGYITNLATRLAYQRVCETQASCKPDKLDRLAAFFAGITYAYQRGSTWLDDEDENTWFPSDNIECVASPLVLDLDRNGLRTEQSGARFDLLAEGRARSLAWIVRGDALLARDLDGSGCVEHGGELFGEGSQGALGATANGFEALRPLDRNGDGKITAADPAFAELSVWQDDGDGICKHHEMRSLPSVGVEMLSLHYQKRDIDDAAGSWLGLWSEFQTKEGHKASLVDVFFSMQSKP